MNKVFGFFIVFILLSAFSSCEKDDNDIVEYIPTKVTLQPDSTAGKDAVFSKIVPNNNYGKLQDIHLYAWTQGGILNVNRIAIDFDFATIPNNTKIDSAFLSLYYNTTSVYGQHVGQNCFIIRRIISAWNEDSITWNKQPITTSQNEIYVTGATSPTQNFLGMNVTSLVQDIINYKSISYGFMLLLQDESPYRQLLFASSENPNGGLRPKLEVYYTIKK